VNTRVGDDGVEFMRAAGALHPDKSD